MRAWIIIVLVLATILHSLGQVPSSKYQPGTIIAVTRHQDRPGEQASETARYDVSIKVGNTTYVVLYTPPNGANGVEYSAGFSILVKVDEETLTFNSKLSGTTQVPILRRETLPTKSGLDWSRLPGEYFTMKRQHLAEALDLSEDQQVKIKPMLEQEAGEAGEVLGNPALSRKEQLSRWEKIVRSTDEKMMPLLSQAQLEKLRTLRSEQKQELKRIVAAQNSPR